MLKFKVDTLDGLEESIKALYEEKDGAFQLKVDGVPKPKDTSDLEDRLKKLEKNNQDLLAEKKKAKEDAEAAALDAAKKGGDIEALEKSWTDKMTSAVSAKDQELNALKEMVSQLTVGSTATALAAELFGEHADLMMHHIKSRLTYEVAEGKPKVRILDDGKPSAKTVDELKEEFRSSQKFAPFVVGSKASGGGPTGRPSGGATKKFTEMTDAERIKLKNDNRPEYDRVVAEFKAAQK